MITWILGLTMSAEGDIFTKMSIHGEVNMPTHASTAKRARSDKKRRLRNKMVKSLVKTAEKKVQQAKDKQEALAYLSAATSALDKASSRRVIHWKKASRDKSRLAKRVNAMKGMSGEEKSVNKK